MQWLPLLGILALVFVVACWRPWLQRRRYGSSGVLFLRSGNWRQNARDGLGLVLAACLLGQAVVAVAWPDALARLHAPAALWQMVGANLLCGGLMLLVLSQIDLGRSWRIGIPEGPSSGLVTRGLYRFSRNPIYLAILVTLLGYAMLVLTVLSVLLLLGAFVGMRQQVLAEEEYLTRTYGGAYRAYAARVGRFVPVVGRLR